MSQNTPMSTKKNLHKQKEKNIMENKTFTAYAWDDGLIICRATFDDKEDAIQFARARNWDKVKDDQTGEVIWHR